MEQVLNPPAIHGPVVPGKAAAVRQELEQLIKKINKSQFDMGDLLYTIKKNGYYEGYNSFFEYTRSLGLKDSKVRYTTRISEVTSELGIPREKYEPLGVAKCRAITSLDTQAIYKNPETGAETPIVEFINGFIEQGKDLSLEEVQQHVRTLKGEVGENAMGWLHLYMKQLAIDNVAKPALEKAKMLIGSVGKDEDGMSKDPSDGAAAEVVFASFNNQELGNE